jgi:hypothetical protein
MRLVRGVVLFQQDDVSLLFSRHVNNCKRLSNQGPINMANQAQQIDFSSVVATLNAMIQAIQNNGRVLTSLVNDGVTIVPGGAATYFHINAPGTYAVRTTPCTLLSLNVNTGAASSTGTIYDVSGTASLPGTAEVAMFTFGTVAPLNVPLGPDGRGFPLKTGLVIVTTGTADITFVSN